MSSLHCLKLKTRSVVPLFFKYTGCSSPNFASTSLSVFSPTFFHIPLLCGLSGICPCNFHIYQNLLYPYILARLLLSPTLPVLYYSSRTYSVTLGYTSLFEPPPPSPALYSNHPHQAFSHFSS